MAAKEPDYEADMKLPAGRTCADCFASKFCIGIGCTKEESTSCDYWPNRFDRRNSATLEWGLVEPLDKTMATATWELVEEPAKPLPEPPWRDLAERLTADVERQSDLIANLRQRLIDAQTVALSQAATIARLERELAEAKRIRSILGEA